MKWNPSKALGAVPLSLIAIAPIYAHAKIYVSIEQVQKIMYPGAQMTKIPFFVGESLQQEMTKISSVRHPFDGQRIWRTSEGDWLIVDEVVGKHEMITYAVAVRKDGTVKGVEILEYVESYGYQVAEPGWRGQFTGKQVADTLKLGKDIQNISGATLSCKHLTDGVKRVLVFHQAALKNYSIK